MEPEAHDQEMPAAEWAATVLTTRAAACLPLVEALGGLGRATTVRTHLEEAVGTGFVCIDVGAGSPGFETACELAPAWPEPLAGARPGLLLLFDGDARSGHGHKGDLTSGDHPEGGTRRLVRSLAHRLAPRARANAILMDKGAVGLEGALRLVLECRGMTGQTLVLRSEPGRALRPTLEFEPPPGKPRSLRQGTRRMFIRDLVLSAFIGVHRHERAGKQRVRLNVDLDVLEGEMSADDRLGAVVCYETMAGRIRQTAAAGHVNLVETLAERVAEICLADPRVLVARVRIEKLDIFEDAVSAGVEIERRQEVR